MSNFRAIRPTLGEYAEDDEEYIAQAPDGDIIAVLAAQQADIVKFFSRLSEQQAAFRYAPGKWSIKEVVGHMCDDERLIASRAHWFGQGGEGPLPSWQGDEWLKENRHTNRPLADLVNEFGHVRASTIDLFGSFHEQAWHRHGLAAERNISVRALAWMAAGHAVHHVKVIRERYLPGLKG